MSTVKNVTTLVLGKGINVVVSLLFLPFLARSLSISEYGDYGQTVLVIDIVKVLFSGGLASIVLVYLSNNKDKVKVISSNYFLGIILGVLSFTLLVCLSNTFSEIFENNDISSLIKLYSFGIIFSIPSSTLSSALIFYKKINFYTKTIIIVNLLRLLLLFISIHFFKSLEFVFISLSLLEVMNFSFLTFVLRKKIDKKYSVKLNNGIQQFKTGVYLNLANLLGFLTLATDSIMISIYENEESFAIYKNGAFEVPLVSVLYLSISQLFLPKITQYFSNNKLVEIANIKKKLSSNIAAIIYPFCIFFISFSSDFITVYLSEKYINSSIIFTIFNLSLLMRIFDYLDVLIASKKTKIILLLQIFSIVLNFVLNLAFIYYFDIIGAAIATLTTLFVYAIIALKMNATTLNTNMKSIIDLPKILLCLTISVTCSLPFYFIEISDNITLSFLIKFLYFPLTFYIMYKTKLIDDKISMFFKQKINKLTA